MAYDVPLVLRRAIDWKPVDWSLDDWQTALDEGDNKTGKYPVRRGRRRCSQEPQWERVCDTEDVTMSELFRILKAAESEERNDRWYYFDYKHLAQWFADSNVLQDIRWGDVGFGDKGGADSTVWIGTAGAHTPCHSDSYGFNVVAQLYGRKMWLLFPPDETENLKPTRVPYEESSVYSRINFACGCNDIEGIGQIRMVVLEPGDVLYVPNKWWHYVENVTTAISVNVWMPLECDDDSRLEESLAKCVVSSLTAGLSCEERETLLNPNEDDLSATIDLSELSLCLRNCETERRRSVGGKLAYGDFGGEKAAQVPVVAGDTLKALLKAKCRSSAASTAPAVASDPVDRRVQVQQRVHVRHLIDAFCHPRALKTVREILQSSSR